MSINLDQKSAIITGSGQGIGAGIAKYLAARGARVVVNDINQEKIDQVVEEIRQNGGTAIGIRADITDPEQAKGLIDQTVEQFGRLDILVNNAGVARDKSIRGMKLEDWDFVLNTNLRAVFLTCQAAAFHMIPQNSGRIINISSRAWLGYKGQANYSASKGGVVSLTRTLAHELAKYNITANCICPGIIRTPLYDSNPEEIKQELLRLQPTRSIGEPEDIAYGVAFFASDDANYITGQTLFICGGKSLFSSLSV